MAYKLLFGSLRKKVFTVATTNDLQHDRMYERDAT